MTQDILIPTLFVVILAIAIATSLFFSSKNKIKRILAKLPDGRINNLRKGEFSKVTGKALNIEEPLIAPYSNRKCIYHKIKIERKRKTGKNSYWDTLVNDEKIQTFFIEKNGDILLIEPNSKPKNYKSYLTVDKQTSSGTFKNASEKFKEVLLKYEIDSENFSGFNKELRYTEAIIEVGEEITVAGITDYKALNKPINGYSYSKITSLKSTSKQKLIITDLDKSKFTSK